MSVLERADNEVAEGQLIQLTWADFAEEQCKFYVLMGVTPEQYWDGDYKLLKYYRQAYIEKRRQVNFDAWLYGLYTYEAICSVAPVLKPFGKATKPLPYPTKPHAFDAEELARHKEEEERRTMEKIRKKTQAYMLAWNAQRKKTNGSGR